MLAPESKLVTLEPDGNINYRRFLQRYVLVTSESVRLRLSIIAQVMLAQSVTKSLSDNRAGSTTSFVNFTMPWLGSSCLCVTPMHC